MDQTNNKADSLNATFEQRLTDLRSSAGTSGASIEQDQFSKWFNLYSDGTTSLDGTSPEEKGKNFLGAFNRDDLNKDYLTAATAKGGPISFRNAQVAKVQLDILAGMERDTRMRYRSRVRMIAHAVARLKSQGLGDGPIQEGIVRFAALLADRK